MTESQAWVVTKIGHPPEIRKIDLKPLASDDVLVRVTATGLNFADLLMIEGKYQETPPTPFVPGMEIAGHVEDLGSGANRFAVGERVMCVPGSGGLASHVVVKADKLRRVPGSMDDPTAAGFQIAYGTSHLSLTRRANIKAGETLVVLGAAGGVGLTAVEIGHPLGARVAAVARGKDKLAIAREAGAEVLIDGDTEDLLFELKELGPIDVIYDAVGGTAGDAALRALAPEGRYLIIGFASGSMPSLRPNHLLVKNQTIIGFYWGGYDKFCRGAMNDSLAELGRWYETGRIRPYISHVLPFERAMEGIDLLRTRQATGKVVIAW